MICVEVYKNGATKHTFEQKANNVLQNTSIPLKFHTNERSAKILIEFLENPESDGEHWSPQIFPFYSERGLLAMMAGTMTKLFEPAQYPFSTPDIDYGWVLGIISDLETYYQNPIVDCLNHTVLSLFFL